MNTNQQELAVTIYVKNDVASYFDSFGVENIRKQFKKFIGNKFY